MKKLFLAPIIVLLLFGCSNKEKDMENTSKITAEQKKQTIKKSEKNSPTIERKINTIMKQKGYPNSEDIIDYEIKGKYIFVLTSNIYNGIVLTIIEDDLNELKWVSTSDTGEATLISPTKSDGPYFMAIQPDDQDVKDVKAFGKQTKLIQITKNISGDFKKVIKCWIFIADDIGKSPKDYNENEDIEYIK